MIIKDDLFSVSKCFFNNKNNYKYLTKEHKEKYFFIFNRYLSKNYPEKAFLLNLKNIDKETSFDLWFNFMKTEPYPDWFWSKSTKDKKEYTDKEYNLLMKMLEIKKSDLDFLVKYKNDFVQEELNYFKKIEKGN
jgi:hypothetical protein